MLTLFQFYLEKNFSQQVSKKIFEILITKINTLFPNICLKTNVIERSVRTFFISKTKFSTPSSFKFLS